MTSPRGGPARSGRARGRRDSPGAPMRSRVPHVSSARAVAKVANATPSRAPIRAGATRAGGAQRDAVRTPLVDDAHVVEPERRRDVALQHPRGTPRRSAAPRRATRRRRRAPARASIPLSSASSSDAAHALLGGGRGERGAKRPTSRPAADGELEEHVARASTSRPRTRAASRSASRSAVSSAAPCSRAASDRGERRERRSAARRGDEPQVRGGRGAPRARAPPGAPRGRRRAARVGVRARGSTRSGNGSCASGANADGSSSSAARDAPLGDEAPGRERIFVEDERNELGGGFGAARGADSTVRKRARRRGTGARLPGCCVGALGGSGEVPARAARRGARAREAPPRAAT